MLSKAGSSCAAGLTSGFKLFSSKCRLLQDAWLEHSTEQLQDAWFL
jgi:hypothetical protein